MNQAFDLVRRYWLWIFLGFLAFNPRGTSDFVYSVGLRLHMVLQSVLGSF